MLELSLIFIAACLCLLLASRILLAIWHWPRVRQAGGLWPIVRGGARIDANQIAMLVGIPLVLSPWLGHLPAAVYIASGWLWFCWMLLVLLKRPHRNSFWNTTRVRTSCMLNT